jgi:hypothetical protein
MTANSVMGNISSGHSGAMAEMKLAVLARSFGAGRGPESGRLHTVAGESFRPSRVQHCEVSANADQCGAKAFLRRLVLANALEI